MVAVPRRSRWQYIFRANDGLNYSDLDEDYVSIPQLRRALLEADIVPIFAVTSAVRKDYDELVKQLETGFVVPLSVNSKAIENHIAQIMGEDRIALVRNTTVEQFRSRLQF